MCPGTLSGHIILISYLVTVILLQDFDLNKSMAINDDIL
jgi:hypothetical protein